MLEQAKVEEVSTERSAALKGNAGELAISFVGVLFLILLTVYCRKAEAGHFLAAVLLALSTGYCFLLAALSFKAEAKPLGGMIWAFGGFEFFKCVLLALYCKYGLEFTSVGDSSVPLDNGTANFLTALCFGLVLAISISSIWLIDHTMDATGGAFAAQLSRLLAVDTFLPLVSMGALFLYATYFLTFAVAFHNLGVRGAGLYAAPFEEQVAEHDANGGVQAEPTSSRELAPCNTHPDSPLSAPLVFPKNRASLACSRALLQKLYGAGWPQPADVHGHFPEISDCRGTNEEEALANLRTAECVKRYLVSSEEPRRVRISLLGHAGEGTISTGARDYQSKYELSLARVQQAHFLLSEIHEEANARVQVEWLLLPISGEEFYLGGSARPDPELPSTLDRRASVEVRLQTLNGRPADHLAPDRTPDPRRLELLDYLYFMVYTITTTGYGDLVPRTPTVKFATAVANLFEVFFLVIAINVLIGSVLDHRRAAEREV